MENSKTIVCPNCGAVSSNLDNCEYCGSIMVRIASIFQEEGKDVFKELKKLGIEKSAYVNPVMLEAIEKCAIQCQKYNTEIRCHFIYDEPGKSVIPPYWAGLPHNEGAYHICGPKLIFQPNSAPKLIDSFSMRDNEENSRFKRLENYRLAKLFEITQGGNYMCCKMQMDNDAKTTAQFISRFFDYIYNTSDSKIVTETYVTINEIKYLIATDEQDKELNEKFNDRYSDYLKILRGENKYASNWAVEQCDEIICNILKQLANVSAWEFGKKQQLQQRYQDRYDQIATRKHFINTEYWRYYNRSCFRAEWGCSHWITENTTVEEIKKMAQEDSVANEPEAISHDTSNDNVSDDSTMQYQDINNSSNAAAQSSNLQDIAKQFVETLRKEVQAKTNINLTHWIIIVLILVIIILIASI